MRTQLHLEPTFPLDQGVAAALIERNEETLKNLDHERAQILIHVQRAYVTMYECLDAVITYKASNVVVTEPPSDPETERLTAMDEAIHRLEQENDVLKRVAERVKTDLSLPTAPSKSFAAGKGFGERRSSRDLPPRVSE